MSERRQAYYTSLRVKCYFNIMIHKWDNVITHHNTFTRESCWYFFHLVFNTRFNFVHFYSDIANSQSEKPKTDICTKIKNRYLWIVSITKITSFSFSHRLFRSYTGGGALVLLWRTDYDNASTVHTPHSRDRRVIPHETTRCLETVVRLLHGCIIWIHGLLVSLELTV